MSSALSEPLNIVTSPVAVDSSASTLRGKTAALRKDPGKNKFEKLQAVFDDNFRSRTEPVKHDSVAVLLLSWKESDIDVSEELSELSSVFRNDYNFNVQHKQLEESDTPQLQLDSILSKFVWKNEGAHNLCIIYYAGHGFSDLTTGDLNLTSNSSQASRREDQRSRNSVTWRAAEQKFKKMKADVLLVFDCCEAGALDGDFRKNVPHSFEFLGACGQDQWTPAPGKHSFTSALIWALLQLKTTTGFDSAELKEKIIHAPHADGERHTPVLFPREYPNFDHVWISPKSPACRGRRSSDSSSLKYRQDKPTDFLELRFRFSKSQTEHQVERLAEALSQFARDQGSNLGIRHVELFGYANKFRDAALNYAKRNWTPSNPNTPISNDMEAADEQKLDTAVAIVKPSISNRAEVMSPPRLQNIVDQEVAKSQRLTMKRVTIVLVSFVAGIFCALFFWHQFFLVPFSRAFEFWEFLTFWGSPIGSVVILTPWHCFEGASAFPGTSILDMK
ncbi:hypothetical protein MPH_01806 [Macrophomina phaseolina MS6]|uniref:Peptidase C14 caspase domain-containing protein n=1 Tax=Macrophomina phaseolina (strain MS6) TaxID=1126212 RepID=K2S7R0_MACPH|nr:hypothetical protein MPH_01806 [Macrophomina phaseolina MS6]